MPAQREHVMPYVLNEKSGKETWRHGPAAPGMSKLETSTLNCAIFGIAHGKTAERLVVSGYLTKRIDYNRYYELTDIGKKFVAKQFPNGKRLLREAAVDATENAHWKMRRQRWAVLKVKVQTTYLHGLSNTSLIDKMLDAMEAVL
jgi:hypothetical protein